jgi:serine/threonine protein kinase
MDKIIDSRPFDRPPLRGRVVASAATRSFLAAVSDCRGLLAGPAAEIFLDGRNKVGAVAIPLESGMASAVVIKEYYSYGINKLKSLFELSKAAKAWRGACALIERGLETPSPLAWLEARKWGFVTESFFLADRVMDGREIRHLLKELPDDELRALLAALARTLRICHERGILHRDLSDGNILVRKDDSPGGGFHFYFLDTNRIRIRTPKTIGSLARAKNLIRLGIPAPQQLFFLERYAGRRGEAPSPAFIFWYRLNKRIFTLSIGLKKKLRLKKLARKLRIQ